jgi:hypothetical protein
MTDWNAFKGFHERQVPMSAEEERRAAEANRLRGGKHQLS